MHTPETPGQIVAQANDTSLLSTEPALVKGAVVGIVTAIGSILVIGGVIDEAQKQALAENAGILIPAVFSIVAIVQAVWTRRSVWAPRTVAGVAIASAGAGKPTLDVPYTVR